MFKPLVLSFRVMVLSSLISGCGTNNRKSSEAPTDSTPAPIAEPTNSPGDKKDPGEADGEKKPHNDDTSASNPNPAPAPNPSPAQPSPVVTTKYSLVGKWREVDSEIQVQSDGSGVELFRGAFEIRAKRTIKLSAVELDPTKDTVISKTITSETTFGRSCAQFEGCRNIFWETVGITYTCSIKFSDENSIKLSNCLTRHNDTIYFDSDRSLQRVK